MSTKLALRDAPDISCNKKLTDSDAATNSEKHDARENLPTIFGYVWIIIQLVFLFYFCLYGSLIAALFYIYNNTTIIVVSNDAPAPPSSSETTAANRRI
jgi:hypothetical protein